VVSPIPFAVFVNIVIKKLSKSGYGYGVRVLRFLKILNAYDDDLEILRVLPFSPIIISLVL